MRAGGRHTIGVMLGDDGAIFQHHQAIGIGGIQKACEIQHPTITGAHGHIAERRRRHRQCRHRSRVMADFSGWNNFVHMVKTPFIERCLPPIGKSHLVFSSNRCAGHQGGHGRCFLYQTCSAGGRGGADRPDHRTIGIKIQAQHIKMVQPRQHMQAWVHALAAQMMVIINRLINP